MEKEKVKILIIDDDPKVSWILSEGLGDSYDIVSAKDGLEGIQMVSKTSPNLVLLDIQMPGMEGLEVLERIKSMDRPTEVIMLSGHGETKNVVESIKKGASEFINKPFDVKEVEIHIQNVLEKNRLRQELDHLKSELKAKSQYDQLIGDSSGMLQIKAVIEQVADSELTVLIRGESGTGKEIVARMLHNLSSRKSGPFVKVNCAAIPRELIESELFGHEKGSFTGAQGRKRGFFEQAHGGTLLLDEIADMDLAAQAKVLRALQSGEVSRVGSERTIHVDVRVLAATNRDLSKAVAAGSFREDLFFRLDVFPIRAPALRERPDDIRLLADAFVRSFCSENGLRPKAIDASVHATLARRTWPGNVRELRNVVERAAILSGDRITVADLPEDPHVSPFDDEPEGEAGRRDSSLPLAPVGPDGDRPTLRSYREAAERSYIIDTLGAFDWNISRAAVALGVERTNLHKKIRAYGIKRGG
jgi:two-component system nitrogen regulation response regulator NtrX